MAKRTLAAKREQFEKAKRELEDARRKEGLRIGEIALEAGLDDIEISDKELKEAFQEIASRFRASEKGHSAPSA